jgi:hypothetical protein
MVSLMRATWLTISHDLIILIMFRWETEKGHKTYIFRIMSYLYYNSRNSLPTFRVCTYSLLHTVAAKFFSIFDTSYNGPLSETVIQTSVFRGTCPGQSIIIIIIIIFIEPG